MTASKNWRREAVLEALLVAPTIAAAAQASGLSERTVRRWMADATFVANLKAAQRRQFADGLGNLSAGLSLAVATLRAALDDASAGVRVRAAIALCEVALRAHDALDVEERLSRLEGATPFGNGRPAVSP